MITFNVIFKQLLPESKIGDKLILNKGALLFFTKELLLLISDKFHCFLDVKHAFKLELIFVFESIALVVSGIWNNSALFSIIL